MSKIFYDHLISLDEVEKEIKQVAETPEGREELWHLVDEIIHHRVLGCILDNLPNEHHEHFLEKFHKIPYDDLLIVFLNEKIEDDVEVLIRAELIKLTQELLDEIRGKGIG